jgi:hypothetical protein
MVSVDAADLFHYVAAPLTCAIFLCISLVYSQKKRNSRYKEATK